MDRTYLVEEFYLKARAKAPNQTVSFLQDLGRLQTQGCPFEEGRKILLRLLGKCRWHQSYDAQNSWEYVASGIENMFYVMKKNKDYVSAPKEADKRRDFYQKLAKGFLFLGEHLKQEYLKDRIGKKELYACLELIGDGGHACAGRWRLVLEEMFKGLSNPSKDLASKDAQKQDVLYNHMKILLDKARVIEANRLAEDFVQYHYPYLDPADKLHYMNFFKRVLNDEKDYHLPIIREEDSYLKDDTGHKTKMAMEFLTLKNLDEDVVLRFMKVFQEELQQDSALYEALVDHGVRMYKKEGASSAYEDVVEFLSQKVFEGETRKAKHDTVEELLLEKGFVGKRQRTVAPKEIIQRIRLIEWDLLNQLLKKLPPEATQGEDFKREMQRIAIPLFFVLMDSIKKGRLSLAKLFIENGANVKGQDIFGNTPLLESAKKGNVGLIECLLEQGADAKAKNLEGKTAMHFAAQSGDTKTLNLLLQAGVLINEVDKRGKTPILMAAESGHSHVVQWLLERGADPQLADNKARTPLFMSAYHGHAEIAQILLDHGAKQNRPETFGTAEIRIASLGGHLEIVKRLWEAGVDIDHKNHMKETPLMFAAHYGQVPTVRFLLDKGADVNAQSLRGWTPLIVAAKNGREDIVEILLKQGADTRIKDKDGNHAMKIAKQQGYPQIAKRIGEEEKERMRAKIEKRGCGVFGACFKRQDKENLEI
jgi:ankyrin repeat protein